MWVDAKVFMDLVAKQTTLELKCKALEERVETLEKRPVVIQHASEDPKETNLSMRQYHELMDGVVDKKAGRVIYTDGRE